MRIRFYERGFGRRSEKRFFKNFDFERERERSISLSDYPSSQVSQSSRIVRETIVVVVVVVVVGIEGKSRNGSSAVARGPVGPRSGQIYATHMRQAV